MKCRNLLFAMLILASYSISLNGQQKFSNSIAFSSYNKAGSEDNSSETENSSKEDENEKGFWVCIDGEWQWIPIQDPGEEPAGPPNMDGII